MKPYEFRPIQTMLLIAAVLYLILFLSGIPGEWTDTYGRFVHTGGTYGTIWEPMLMPWFLKVGPIFLNSLAILLAAGLSSSLPQLRFQLLQPQSRDGLLLRQVKIMALILGGFALVGTVWAVLTSSVSFGWGIAPFKNMIMLWAIALFWGVLTLGLIHVLKFSPVLIVPGVLLVCMMVIRMFYNSDMFSVNPVYHLQVVVPVSEGENYLRSSVGLEHLIQVEHVRYTVSGDLKLMWSLLMLGLVYLGAQLGFRRRSLF